MGRAGCFRKSGGPHEKLRPHHYGLTGSPSPWTPRTPSDHARHEPKSESASSPDLHRRTRLYMQLDRHGAEPLGIRPEPLVTWPTQLASIPVSCSALTSTSRPITGSHHPYVADSHRIRSFRCAGDSGRVIQRHFPITPQSGLCPGMFTANGLHHQILVVRHQGILQSAEHDLDNAMVRTARSGKDGVGRRRIFRLLFRPPA